MKLLGIDFETYYSPAYGLKNHTTSQYVMSPQFEMIGVGLRYGNTRVWLEEKQWIAFAAAADWSQIGCVAHHAHFDGLIMAHHYGIKPAYWLDTLSMARALHGTEVGGSLAKLMEFYQVGVKGDEVVKAIGKRRGDFTQEEWLRYGDYCMNDVDGTIAILNKMLPIFPKDELDLVDTTVRMFTEPVLVLNQNQMAEYYGDEIKRKEELLTRIKADKKTLGSNGKLADLFRALGVEPGMKDSPKAKNADGTPKRVYAFAKTDPAMQELLEHEDDDVRLLAEARISVKSTINESRTLRLLQLGSGGRPMPVYLNFSGAKQTFRWSGGDRVNWQNFEKTNKKNPRKGIIRKSICAPLGKKIVKADASQVEARFNAWFSEEEQLVTQFANGEDVYSLFATDAYGRKVDRKNVAADEQPGQVAKICVLGLGYRMGWLKLAMELLMGRGGAPKIQFTREDIERLNVNTGKFLANPRIIDEIKAMPSRLNEAERMIHCAVTNHFVQAYRNKYTKIVGNWSYWDTVIEWMYSGQYIGAPVGPHGILTLHEDGLMMPHGFPLRYKHIEWKKETGFTFLADRNQRKRFHGGFIVENYTQALTRVIVADAVRSLTWGRQRAGLQPYKVAQTEHDAISCVVEEARAGECLIDLQRAISTPPAWAKGLPLASEGGIYNTMGG